MADEDDWKPKLTDGVDLQDLQLSSEEGFLLSRIDGVRQLLCCGPCVGETTPRDGGVGEFPDQRFGCGEGLLRVLAAERPGQSSALRMVGRGIAWGHTAAYRIKRVADRVSGMR